MFGNSRFLFSSYNLLFVASFLLLFLEVVLTFISWFTPVDNYAPAMSKKCSDIFNAGHVKEKVNFTITERIFARWLVESYGLWEFSIITLMIIENRALWLARSFALSRYNHRAVIITLKANIFQNGSQIFFMFRSRKLINNFVSSNNRQCNYTKTISRRRRRDYRRIVTSTLSRWLLADIHVAFGD